MIISAQHSFGFVHIAKCAGSTIRQQLRDIDDLGGRFYRSMEHPELGRINANHLPLHILERYFPEEFAALQSVTSYTLLREPMDRFISGISQLARGKGTQPGEMSAKAIRMTAHGVMDYLVTAPSFPDFRHTLFIRQAEYVDLHGQRVIDHAYPTEAIERLMTVLETDHGLALMRDTVWNPTVSYKVPAIAGGLKRLKKTAQKTLPLGAYVRLRDIGLRLFTSKGAPNLTEALVNDTRTKDFVSEFYAMDIALHRAALQTYPPDTLQQRAV